MQPLIPNMVYHIFNHANGFENTFRSDNNFRFFLEKYRHHISPVAETYAYCLMPNHFHIVVRIRQREIIEKIIEVRSSSNNGSNFAKVQNFGKVVDDEVVNNEVTNEKVIDDKTIELFLSKQFANLFSSYTQSFNKVFNRRGSLFLKAFKRIPITNKQYFLNSIVYTHRNPVHHGFCTHFSEWQYSSYNEIIDERSDIVEFEKLLKMFDDKNNFIDLHENKLLDLPFANDNDI
ncbi:MAG: transposase [Bacteroidetes bacterium]|nr:transposase [Bacteroidota bacterium]